jgi:hypothetical protein
MEMNIKFEEEQRAQEAKQARLDKWADVGEEGIAKKIDGLAEKPLEEMGENIRVLAAPALFKLLAKCDAEGKIAYHIKSLMQAWRCT